MTDAYKDTQPKFDGLDDARLLSGSDNLLYKTISKTRSGHVFELNDNKDVESVTLQHRTGAMIQMQPDGSVRFVSQNGKMGFEINGQGYVKVTGAYDIIADGDYSVRAKAGNMHFTGDLKLTVDGTYSVSAKNMTTTVAEKFEQHANDTMFTSVNNTAFVSGGYQYIGSGADGMRLYTSGTMTRKADGNISDTATRIDHN